MMEIGRICGKVGKNLVRELVKSFTNFLRGEVCRFFIEKERVGFFTKEAMKKMMKERTKCMELIEMMVVMGKNRMIQLPEEEVNVMGLKEGDELCLSLHWSTKIGHLNCIF